MIELCRHLGVWPDGKGECWCPCPFCGKERKHFSFSVRGYRCFHCGERGGLRKLAEQVGLDTGERRVPDRLPLPARPERPQPRWQQYPETTLDSLERHPERIERWQAYKPLSAETIQAWRLGYGRLPSVRCPHERLTYPVYESGRLVALRGRAVGCGCDKWLSAAGSVAALFNRDGLAQAAGRIVLVVENPIDALLAMERRPELVAVASTAGASTWRPEWTQAVVEADPAAVLVWLDNDLAGCPNEETYRVELARWRREHPRVTSEPQPNGPKIANALVEAGLRMVTIYQWPAGTPAKADLGELLSAEVG